MKKLQFILSSLCLVFAFVAAMAFSRPATETAWFALDPDTGNVEQYIGSTPPDCIVELEKFCAAEYPGVDANQKPVGQRIQTITDARLP